MPIGDIGIWRLEVAPERDAGVVVDAGEAADTGAVIGAVDVRVDAPVVNCARTVCLVGELPLHWLDQYEGEDLAPQFAGEGVEAIA